MPTSTATDACWLIDDTPVHHDTARRTITPFHALHLVSFLTGHAALAAYRRALTAGQALPRIVLMDYVLGAERGDRVTRALRQLDAGPASRLCIVGYSSMASASQAIVEAGGDCIVRKQRAGNGTNPSLAAFLDAWRRAHPRR
jgi:CheY-like chemotaxis protein